MINQTFLISVIIPIHNRFIFANESVQSVFNQTYHPIELIIVDDASELPYVPQVRSKAGFEIQLIRFEKNKGPGASRETGRQAATGDFIAYLDSDDLWHPDKLQKQVAMLQSHPETGMCYCQSIEFTQWPLTGKESLRSRSNRAYTEFLPVVLEQRPWGTGACLWTREATNRIGPWFNARHFEDIEYESRAGCHDIKIAYIPEVLCYYRVNSMESSLSVSLNKSSASDLTKSVLKISENLKRCNKLKNQEVKLALIQRLFKTSFSVLSLKNRRSAFMLQKEICFVSNEWKVKIVFFFTAFFSLISPLNIMDKLKYRLKKFIYSKPQQNKS